MFNNVCATEFVGLGDTGKTHTEFMSTSKT